jgi:hypothetical protein
MHHATVRGGGESVGEGLHGELSMRDCIGDRALRAVGNSAELGTRLLQGGREFEPGYP